MIRRFLILGVFMMLVLQFSVMMTQPAHADNFGDSCTSLDKGKTFFGIPVWYKYIDKGTIDSAGNCVPEFTFPQDIWAIGLAVIDGLLRVGGIVAVFFVTLAGIAFMTSRGSPDRAAAARQRVLNAVVGLIIVVVSAGIVQFVGNRLQQ